MHYPLRLKLGVIAAVFFFAAAIGVVSLIAWRQNGLTQSVGGDAAWAAYKLDREAVELRSLLLRSEPGSDEDLANVQLGFELLYSRTNLLRTGQIAELFWTIDSVSDVLPRIFSQVESIDRRLNSAGPLDPSDIDLLQSSLATLGDSSQRLVIAINEYLAESKTRERETLLKLYGLLLALGGFRYHAAAKRLELTPRLAHKKGRLFFAVESGWGSIAYAKQGRKLTVRIEDTH